MSKSKKQIRKELFDEKKRLLSILEMIDRDNKRKEYLNSIIPKPIGIDGKTFSVDI